MKKVRAMFGCCLKTSYFCIAFQNEGHLAQLVQSVCLTSRGSGVRIPQCPHTQHFVQESYRSRALSSAGSERLPYKQRVGGSNPSVPTTTTSMYSSSRGRLAQLVQSVCLTSRGSGVRIPQRPHPNWPVLFFGREPFFNVRRSSRIFRGAKIEEIHPFPQVCNLRSLIS